MKLAAVLICVLLLVGLTAAQPYYSGAYGDSPHCQGCHAAGGALNQFPYWLATGHATTYDDNPEVQNDITCLPCHTTGWNPALNNGGFDDYFFLGDSAGCRQMRNVQCESCHGPTDQIPHPATTAVDFHSEVCSFCHSAECGFEYTEWSASPHSRTAPESAQQTVCAKCHEATSAALYLKTGVPPAGMPSDPVWQITCAACHANHEPSMNFALLYLEPDSTCRTCHNIDGAFPGYEVHASQHNMLCGVGNGGYQWPGYTYSNSAHQTALQQPCILCHMDGSLSFPTMGHLFTVNVETCIDCHPGWIPPDSSFDFLGVQTEIDSLLLVLADALSQADSTMIEYDRAKFDHDFVLADGSRGIHNFQYARGLLISSIEGLASVAVNEKIPVQPTDFRLSPPRPNPFNAQTVFVIQNPLEERLMLSIFDLSGRLVAAPLNARLSAGRHEILWHAVDFPSGIYIYSAQAGTERAAGKVVLLK